MTHLGAFGSEHEPVDVTFDYFGQVVHARPELSDLDYVDFLERAGGIDVNDLSSLGLVKDFARICIAEDDFDLFWSTARARRQNVEDIFTVLTAVLEAATERPTGQPSDSADGPTSTVSRSADVDLSRALKATEGRPDLQVFVTKQAQAV